MHQLEVAGFHESGHSVVHNYFNHPLEPFAIDENGGHCRVAARWQATLDKNQIIDLASRATRQRSASI
jgi:hypothetical protein